MVKKRLFVLLSVMVIGLLAATACAPTASSPATGDTATSDESATTGDNPVSGGELASAPEAESEADQGGGEGKVVEETPIPAEQLQSLPPGQTGPGAAAGDESLTEPGPEGGQFVPGTGSAYVEATYKFTLEYPTEFVVGTVPTKRLAELRPTPVAAFTFMNPKTASSDTPELEIADLEVRVFTADQAASLNDWLVAASLLPADGSISPTAVQTANASGVRVCGSTMIAPACSYFFMNNGWIYQLRASTLEGEAMVTTFGFTP